MGRMKPTEIQQLKQHSPALQEALRKHRNTIWTFLREQVFAQYILPCERCGRHVKLFRSPYAWDLCIECLLREMETPLLRDQYRDPRARLYDAEYAASCQYWEDFYTVDLPDDYDGPPIVIG